MRQGLGTRLDSLPAFVLALQLLFSFPELCRGTYHSNRQSYSCVALFPGLPHLQFSSMGMRLIVVSRYTYLSIASLITWSCLVQESVMVVILSMLASVSGESWTLGSAPPGSSSTITTCTYTPAVNTLIMKINFLAK